MAAWSRSESTSSMVAAFEVPQVAANDEGWGPQSVPEQLDGVPYAPFGKGDKIGRVSDFTAAGLRYGENCLLARRSYAS